jgi:uncharacterized membrane-anchored protein
VPFASEPPSWQGEPDPTGQLSIAGGLLYGLGAVSLLSGVGAFFAVSAFATYALTTVSVVTRVAGFEIATACLFTENC